jgi:hypothetical protein
LVDALKLAEYVYLSSQRFAAYRNNTLVLFALGGLSRVLMIGVPPEGVRGTMPAPAFSAAILRWMESAR